MVPLSFGCGSAVFAAIATLAPSRAARNAIASPMPRLPPDTNSVLPSSDVIGGLRLVHSLITGARRFFVPPALWGRERTFVRGNAHLSIRVQNPAAGFGQRKGGEEEHGV